MSGYGVFAAHYDGLTENVSYGARAAYFDSLIRRHMGSAELVLDLACGTGSLSLELAKLGYDLIGVDGSPDMLSVAMQKAAEEGQQLLFLCQDMTRLDLYGTIDAAVCALDSLNHLPDAKSVARVLEKVSLFLNPGGLFLFDVNTVYKHQQVLANNTFVYETDDVYCVWQNTCPPESRTVDISLDFFVRDGKVYHRESEGFSETAYSHEEMLDMIRAAGLEFVACYEGDTLEPLGEKTERAVYVTRKPVQSEK